MNSSDFVELLQRFSAAATAGDGSAFADCFTPGAIYHDYVYGDHSGRAEIKSMLEDQFHRDAGNYDWRMIDPVINGEIGYARSLSTFTSKVAAFEGQRVVIDGFSRFEIKDGLINDYAEQVNAGVAMVQLGVAPGRMEKVFQRWAGELKSRADVTAYLHDLDVD